MDTIVPSLFGLTLAGAAAGLGTASAVARTRAHVRMLDVTRPRIIAAAALWAGLVPVGLVGLAGPPWVVPAAAFAWLGLGVALADLAALRVPHVLSAWLALAGLACAAVQAPHRAAGAAASGAAALLVFHVARLAFRKARGRDGLGGGDPGVMAALAVWAGPTGAPWVLALGGALALVAAGASRREGRAPARVPLAACLVAASAAVALVGAAMFGAPFWIMESLW